MKCDWNETKRAGDEAVLQRSSRPVERTEQLNLRTLACVQWDECFITIMYKGTLALDTAAFWSAYISRKTPACTAAKYC